MREQVELLEDHAGLGANAVHLGVVHARDALLLVLDVEQDVVVDDDPTARRRVEQIDAAQQRGFPRPRRPDQHDDLAFANRRVDAAYDLAGTEAQADAFQPEDSPGACTVMSALSSLHAYAAALEHAREHGQRYQQDEEDPPIAV